MPNSAHAGIALLGIPFDQNSSYLRGPAEAPARIREAFRGDSTNTWSESGHDIAQHLHDLGDLPATAAETSFSEIEGFVSSGLAQRDATPIALGGDHSITFPVIQ